MPKVPSILCCLTCLLAGISTAQQSFNFQIPDAQIRADRVLRGDGDTYGLGDWTCTFTIALEGTELVINGKIRFTERANDFTTIVGEYHRRIFVGELERCRHCNVSLVESYGQVSGPNIGARGYRWFDGQRLIRRANIQTDVFGTDASQIGGTVQFMPVRILVDCSIAQTLKQTELRSFMPLVQVQVEGR